MQQLRPLGDKLDPHKVAPVAFPSGRPRLRENLHALDRKPS